MGNPNGGGIYVAASVIGTSPEEYRRRREGGERWCTGCIRWHSISEFGSDRGRPDGIARECKQAGRDRYHRTKEARARKYRGKAHG